jgi:hypothetical protein
MPARFQTQELMSNLTNPTANNEVLVSELKSLRQEVTALRQDNTAENTAMQRDMAITASRLKRIDATGTLTREE